MLATRVHDDTLLERVTRSRNQTARPPTNATRIDIDRLLRLDVGADARGSRNGVRIPGLHVPRSTGVPQAIDLGHDGRAIYKGEHHTRDPEAQRFAAVPPYERL